MAMNLLAMAASFLLGYFAEKITDYLFGRFSAGYQVWRTKRRVGQLREAEHRDILVTCSGVPCFLPQNVVVQQGEEEDLYLAFPDAWKGQVPESAGAFHREDVGLERVWLPGCPPQEVASAVEAARQSVAEKFVRREDGLYFNGEKYGILYCDGFSRTADAVEDPILTLRLFKTDHFTHRVLSEAAQRLAILPAQLSPQALNGPLGWLRTSYGLSIIVVLRSSNQMILTRRARYSSFSEGKDWIYVSATETFTATDDDPYTHGSSLSLCVQRGILEELGITQAMYSAEDIRFYDGFFETHFFQDGLVASVPLKKEVDFSHIRDLMAKDKALEVESMFLLDNRRQAIEQFIRDHREDMRSQTAFALRSYAARL